MELSHLDENGQAHMVDVSGKAVTDREALASARVKMKPETLNLILQGGIPKGDVFSAARIAGIMAAKRTHELIPLCHPIPLSAIDIRVEVAGDTEVLLYASVKTTWQTGVEMEALTAVSVAALTIYDMCKAVDRGMEINAVRLESKTGGKSGSFKRQDAA
ncbi:MAG TPA: cyclic pyranopterin monophosphate synthase MoaC [Anaerolineaceae bacterium]|jgi:cyclic pyranopterin phosphate synthase|nr:cyclic pyranopterin monophosphate synthase MoaC [Anaerolineaceae bacterium]HPT24041.1 cyclic pyranopterin monophosphate synthase MoaC [Anaerolineaceae bacterium]